MRCGCLAVADDMYTPDEWAPSPIEGPHDHKGHSEEKCVRCGWVMGHRPLNCMNDNTPHRFPSQEAEIERLRAAGDALADTLSAWIDGMDAFEGDQDRLRAWREARRG